MANIVIITGMSGAGRSSALRILEDFGYEAIDNIPLHLLPLLYQGEMKNPLAIGIDARSRDFSAEKFMQELQHLRDNQHKLRTIFLDASDEILQRRFSETRRKHPLARDRAVSDGIDAERSILWEIRNISDRVIDTSDLSAKELKNILQSDFALEENEMVIAITSFSYKRGLPRDADMIFDARFLRNPHYVPTLKEYSGENPAVAAYVRADEAYQPFLEGVAGMLESLLPRFAAEGRSYITIAIGCTGGKHRSVCFAHDLHKHLQQHGIAAQIRHRDMGRE